MAVAKSNAELPESEKLRLATLRDNPDQRGLHERAVALREAGWPLRAIGDAVGVSRMTVHVWQKSVQANPDAVNRVKNIKNVPHLPMDARGSGVTVRKMRVDVPPRDRERLKALAQEARTVRRWSAPDSPERKASDELDSLVQKYVEERGVAPMSVARHAGVTRRAIMARLERIHAREELTA
jgi:predicted regulator of amino acid metabolism with ACT domain